MKIAITGATGQLGHIIISKLIEKVGATQLVALVRNTAKATDLGVEARTFDYNKPETLVPALQNIDKLILVSGSEVGQRAQQHANVIEAAKKAGVKHIIYTSLLHADSSTLSLAPEHLETEANIKSSGISYTILRNSWYTENYTGSVAGALAGGAFIGSAGDGKIASAARKDYAEAAVVVATTDGQEGKTYELAGDSYYTLTDLAAEISKQTGKNIPYKNFSESEYAERLKSFGISEGLAQAIAGWDISASKNDLFDDGKQLSQLIGHATTPLSEMVAEALKG